jgi:hypothetical protein
LKATAASGAIGHSQSAQLTWAVVASSQNRWFAPCHLDDANAGGP